MSFLETQDLSCNSLSFSLFLRNTPLSLKSCLQLFFDRMHVECDHIEGEILWESDMKKRGRITHLWFKRCGNGSHSIYRWMILSTTGVLYSQRIRSSKPVYKQVYKVSRDTKLYYSLQYMSHSS